MSKYIKLDTAIEHTNQLYHGYEVEAWLESLPTIEVSEDCENCKHENEPRFGIICGSCTKANSENFEPKVSEERQERQDAIDVLNAFTKAVEGTYADCISREDAIKAYNEAVDELVKAEMEEFNLGDFTECSFNTTQLKLIARKIEDAPSVVPQVPKEDAISRKGIKIRLGKRFSDDPRRIMEIVKETVDDAPSVIPQPKEGEWVEDEYGIPHCSECNCINNTVYRNYCPNCGSRMKGADDEVTTV